MASTIFYGAGDNATTNLSRFIEKAGEPVCFVDADIRKHYTSFNYGEGRVDILPLNVTVEKFPDYELWLTQIPESLLKITEYLIEQGIPKERIHYLEEVEYRLGCRNLGKLIVINYYGIRPCCYPKGKFVCSDDKVFTPQNLPVYLEKFKQWLNNTLQKLREGDPTDCDGCSELKEALINGPQKVIFCELRRIRHSNTLKMVDDVPFCLV